MAHITKILLCAFIFIHGLGSSIGQDRVPTVDDIIRAWKARQDKVQSARFEFIREQTIYRGSTSFLASFGGNKDMEVSPPRDYLVSQPVKMSLAGTRIRHYIERQLWDPSDKRLFHRTEESVFNDKVAKTLETPTNAHTAYPSGWVKNATRAPFAQRFDIAPLILAIRGSHPDFYSAINEFNVTGKTLIVAQRQCLELVKESGSANLREVFYLDGERDFIVVRKTIFQEDKPTWQFDVTYKPDFLVNWMPESWEYIVRAGKDSHMQDSGKCTISKYELNPVFGEGEFELEFPPATRVFDETAKQQTEYVISEDGGKGRQIISSFGPRYEDLTKPVPVFRRWFLVSCASLAVILALVVWKRCRRVIDEKKS